MINYIQFPDVSNSTKEGLLAAGGDLEVDTLVSAYSQGIFPWFNHDQPILWWSPDPRMVLYPESIKVSRSLRKLIRQNRFQIRCNTQFESVIRQCALRGATNREKASEKTWITDSMHQAYLKMHKNGIAHSIEILKDNNLVGGLYGLALDKVFFGESMFSTISNTSKIALHALCQHLKTKNFEIIDCQVASDHLISMGAETISRPEFLTHLSEINNKIKNLNYSPHDYEFSNGFGNSLSKILNKQ